MSLAGGDTPGRGLPRGVEVGLALTGLALAAPLLALAGLVVAATSGRPVIFRQERVGLGGRSFELYKLRTMREGNGGARVTAAGDPRITAVGRLLRRFKLDELPALWNVVRGDMSLVGPRPEVPRYVDLGQPAWRRALAVRPGLTDPVTLQLRNEEVLMAQVDGDREAFYRERLQPYKLRGYLDYLERRTWRGDLALLARTALAAVAPSRTPPPPPAAFAVKGPDEPV